MTTEPRCSRRHAGAAFVLAALALAACKSKRAPLADAGREAGTTAHGAFGPPATTPGQGTDLRTLLCGERPSCRLAGQVPAGDAIVATIVLGEEPVDAGDDADPLAEFRDDLADVETWLVTKQGDVFTRGQLLVTKGLRGGGEPWTTPIAFARGALHFELGGADVPSTWKGNESVDIGLTPPRVVQTKGFYYNSLQRCPSEDRETTNDGFTTSVTWRRATCELPGDDACTKYFDYQAIPQVKLPADFEREGWKTTDLGACAIVIDGGKGRGFLTFGKTGGAADAEMRIVMSEARVLYVEVRDDHFTEPAKPSAWAKADHLEIWSARSADSYMFGCGTRTEKPTQWGVAASVIAPGVFLGVRGDDKGLEDARPLPIGTTARSAGVMRFQVRLPPWDTKEDLEALTIAYSDSDDGKSQKSLIATSKLVFGRLETLGRVEKVRRSCELANGKLAIRRPDIQPAKALYPPER